MKTKLVTGYWMDSPDFPFRTVDEIRKGRYLGSIKSHCENIGLPVICYTHRKSLSDLEELKFKYNLSNLTIKIMELSDMKYHNRFMEIRKLGNNEDSGRGCEIMWGKFQVIENELNDCDRVFWIDAGLQHPGIFPWRFAKKHFKKEDHITPIPNWHIDHDVFNFKRLLNDVTFEKLNHITKNKIIILGCTNNQHANDYYDFGLVESVRTPPFPIGGLFGGDVEKVKIFINHFWSECEKVLNVNLLRTEEYVMKLAYDNMSEVEKTYVSFDAYATFPHDDFHFEEWDKEKNLKPLYMVWVDILNH
jgi:hypothetical protein